MQKRVDSFQQDLANARHTTDEFKDRSQKAQEEKEHREIIVEATPQEARRVPQDEVCEMQRQKGGTPRLLDTP